LSGINGTAPCESLCGIQPDPDHPGFKHFFVRPSHAGNLKEAAAEYHSRYGIIRSAWERGDDRGVLTVTVPPNSTATLQPPGIEFDTLAVNGKSPAEAVGVLETLPSKGQVRVTSGTYRLSFASQ